MTAILRFVSTTFHLFFVWVTVVALTAIEEVKVDAYILSAAIILTGVEIWSLIWGLLKGGNKEA